jgi:hypothetical protein
VERGRREKRSGRGWTSMTTATKNRRGSRSKGNSSNKGSSSNKEGSNNKERNERCLRHPRNHRRELRAMGRMGMC